MNRHVLIGSGFVTPGRSAGLITIEGNYTQESEGTLEIELGGTQPEQFDRLEITGDATLDGTLEISLIDGFTPALSDRFRVMIYASRTGFFSRVEGREIGNGLAFTPEYNANDLTLVVTCSGDVNRDGCVDDLDAFAVLLAIGTSGSGLPEDLNGDGVVDNQDLSIVLSNLGSGQGC